jgi:hypothetical protein
MIGHLIRSIKKDTYQFNGCVNQMCETFCNQHYEHFCESITATKVVIVTETMSLILYIYDINEFELTFILDNHRYIHLSAFEDEYQIY